MSYLVLARKWRPQAFDDVTGQEHVVQTLANAIAQERLAHAFLLCGPRGVGKTTTARLLARAMNCAEGPTATPCGVCAPCKEIVAGSSVDVVEIDGASNNGVDSVRELRESARYLPQRDRHKVFIIDEVHMLSVAAFNALLKTLEEPPPHVKFIFATTDPQKLPETILSRVQRHNFRRVPAAKMVERLQGICRGEGISISDHALALIARQADGGMRDALSLLDQLLSAVGLEIDDAAAEEALGLVDRAVVQGLADGLIDRNGRAVVELLAAIYERGIDPKRLCEELAHHLRDLIYVQAIGQAPDGLGDVEAAALTAQAGRVDPTQLARLFDRVHGAIRELSFAAQPRLALEVALLSAVHLAPAQGLAALAARLEALAGSLGSGGPPTVGSGGRGAPRVAAPPAPRSVQQASAPPAPRSAGGHGGSRPGSLGGGAKASPPAPEDDLIGQVEALARAKAGGPRQSGGRASPGRPPAAGGDDEPGGGGRPSAPNRSQGLSRPAPVGSRGSRPADGRGIGAPAPRGEVAPPALEPVAGRGIVPAALRGTIAPSIERTSGGRPAFDEDEPPPPGDFDLPPDFDEAPARTFVVDTSPGGCATNECGDVPATVPAAKDDRSLSIHERWSLALEVIRAKDEMLYRILAEGRLAWLRDGEIALGFSPSNAFHRAQLESGSSRGQAEELFSAWFGKPTRLKVQAATEDAPASVADQDRSLREQRAQRLRAEAREHPAVLAVLSTLGGTIEAIDVLEER